MQGFKVWEIQAQTIRAEILATPICAGLHVNE